MTCSKDSTAIPATQGAATVTSRPDEDTSLLRVDEVAARCRLSVKAIRNAIHRGELRASKLCGRVRVDPLDLQAWLDANAIRPDDEAARSPTLVRGPSGPGSVNRLRAIEASGRS